MPSGSLADTGVSLVAVSYSGLSAPIVRAEVELATAEELEPVVGSFVESGMTFAIQPDGTAMLVAVGSGASLGSGATNGADEPAEGVDEGSLASADATASGAAAPSAFAIPASVEHAGCAYEVTAIGAHALSLCEADEVVLPASVASVDEDALWPSAVQRVEVDPANPTYASHDGILYDAGSSRLLSIPGGREGAVRISDKAEEVETSAFSHGAGVDAISVDAGGAAFSSWDGLLYDASGATLLRVPAGATDVTIRDGCTAVAPGALEGCTSLERIEAPASVTSVSLGAFSSMPILGLPAQVASGALSGEESASASPSAQVSGLVALSAEGEGVPSVDPSSIEAMLLEGADAAIWRAIGVQVVEAEAPIATAASASAYAAASYWTVYVSNTAAGYITVTSTNISGVATGTKLSQRSIMTGAGTVTVTGSSNGNWSWVSGSQNAYGYVAPNPGYSYKGWSTSQTGSPSSTFSKTYSGGTVEQWAIFAPNPYTIALKPNADGVTDCPATISTVYDAQTALPTPKRTGYDFVGWDTAADGSGTRYRSTATKLTTTSGGTVTLYAQWERIDYNLGFDVDSEPADENNPGDPRDDQVVTGDQVGVIDQVEIEDPKRPGYVFQGWVLPSADGTEAIDQDLVYQGDDGKWYVDSSKLPEYAGADRRIELTARWTSVISVDVPSRVTFFADVVTQGQGSRDGLVQGAFAQAKAANRSEVPLRIVGLEAEGVASSDSMLGADSVLRIATDATPANSAQKLMSVYPAEELPTSDELKDPYRVSVLPDGAVGFDLGDTLLEGAFDPDAYAIPAGGELSLGYRLNLAEAGIELDYDALSSLDPGQSAPIATVSYTFATDLGSPFWTTDDDGSILGLQAIKADAKAIAAGDAATTAKYQRWLEEDHRFYAKWYDQGFLEATDPLAATVYDVRIIGLNHDQRADGDGTAGITFQFVNCLNDPYRLNNANSKAGGWGASWLRARMNPGTTALASGFGTDDDAIWNQVPVRLQGAMVPVQKGYSTIDSGAGNRMTSTDCMFLLSYYELAGDTCHTGNSYYMNNAYVVNEGTRYAYWARQIVYTNMPVGNNIYPALWKGTQASPDSHLRWWERTVFVNYPNYTTNFYVVNEEPTLNAGNAPTAYVYVCPAFCL